MIERQPINVGDDPLSSLFVALVNNEYWRLAFVKETIRFPFRGTTTDQEIIPRLRYV